MISNILEFLSIYYMWFIWYIVFTLCLYCWGIKHEWHKIRVSRGIESSKNTNPPRAYNKFRLSKKYYIGQCFKLFISTVILSAIIMLVFMLLVTDYSVKTATLKVKVTISLVLFYSIFMGLIDGEDFDENEQISKGNYVKQILKIFLNFRNRLINSVINDEYQIVHECIHSKIKEWDDAKTEEDDKIGIFIIRIDAMVQKEFDNETDTSIVDRYKDLLYEISDNYINGNNAVLFDNLVKLVDDVILEKLKISIIEIAKFMENQTTTSMKKTKIIEEINKSRRKIQSGNLTRIGIEDLRHII